MTPNKFLKPALAASVAALLLSACGSNDTSQGPTLADIDINARQERKKLAQKKQANQKNRDEIRQAYRKYVEGAASNDVSRQKALTRLAQLELELSNSINDDEQEQTSNQDTVARASLDRTITLLETTLRDYPNAKNNDKVLYQLAQAYDRAGEYNKSIKTLEQLSKKYRRSIHFPEAQFRVAEAAFARGDYITAEDAYTEVVLTPGSEKFYEKSLFKRGWARYKQQFYREAIDDYFKAVEQHEFEEYKQLTDAEKSQFDEYFRAIGLAFSYEIQQTPIKTFFANRKDFPYIYLTYKTVGDIYLKQERFSDAATVLDEFASLNPNSKHTPEAKRQIIAAWREGGFTSKLYSSIQQYYTQFNPQAPYWKLHNDEAAFKETQGSLRTYLTQVSSYFHNRYQKSGSREDYTQAKTWYSRYLKHFDSYANQDNTYTLYAELLLAGNEKQQALGYFAKAAYDDNIILDKKAAYSTIVITSQLSDSAPDATKKSQWLEQHLRYALRFIELYPADNRTESIAANAVQRAFKDKQYTRAIDIANFLPDQASDKTHFTVDTLKARAYLAQKQYADAEAVYLELLDSKFTKRKEGNKLRESLALAIYRQAEQARDKKQIDLALSNFTRISKYAPRSELASTGLYDAIALSMQNKIWDSAIGLIKQFQARYPKHKLNKDVSKKLSVAYLQSDQKGKAAQEFEKIAKLEDNLEVKRAALWQAAELYRSKNNIDGAINAYREYAHNYKKPYAQNMEAMYALTSLYKQKGDVQKRYFWQNRIKTSDQKATKREKSDRTSFIASTTLLDLAKQKQNKFKRYRLVEPIARNLKKKKGAMQEAVLLYGKASSYGMQEVTTAATLAIGEIYQTFSQELLDSERPKNLNEDELEQYEILLEDQAFPFEEKAIEFYETNVMRTQEDIYDESVDKSFEYLKKLFPVRYQRKGKTSVFRG